MSFDLTQNIRHHGFKRLLLAVSGGLDSICLAHYFIVNREVLGIEWLGIAHVHHGLREGTADRDAAFVETFARKYNVPFFLKKLDGEALKSAESSLEENARDARYKALVEIVNEIGDSRLRGNDNKGIIVTAHHAGDQAETMYMRLRRGTTLAGLRGIQSLRALDSIGHGTFHTTHLIYRPFLNVTREELLAYTRENNLTWCEDESNADMKFARNKVRHELLPLLERECPGATAQLCRIAELADRAYKKVMKKCYTLFTVALCKEPLVKEIPTLVAMRTKQQVVKCCPPAYAGMTSKEAGIVQCITLDRKKLSKILREHADADLSEMFRLWLAEQGFRFPIGFFYGPKEPAHVKIPHRAAYRRRSIVKIGHTIKICEFRTPEEAQKFVSCEMKEKGL